MSDFAPRRPAASDVTPQRPMRPVPLNQAPASPVPSAPQSQTAPSQATSALRPMMQSPKPAEPRPAATAATEQAPFPRIEDDQPHESHAPKERHETAHSGIVGLIVFIVLTALLFSPFIPGKVLDNFPGSSASFSNGDQTLACIDTIQNVTSKQSYDSKLGSPVVYKYATTSTQTGTCDGKAQTAITGHTSQFNPLGAAMDLVLALIVALVVAKVWRKLFAHRR